MNKELKKDIADFSKKLVDKDNFLAVSHHDADGISACAIMVDVLGKLSRKVDFMIIKQLDSSTITRVKESSEEMTDPRVVFTDMGSGQLSLIEKNIEDFYVIDHHPPSRKERHSREINPHFYGYDGGGDVSGSGMAYFVAKSLGYRDMADIAIVGAVGDMQDYNGKLHSLNRIILEDGADEGILKLGHDLRIFGRQSRPLPQMLAFCSDPFIPGLTGEVIACRDFIEDLGIELMNGEGNFRSYVELSEEERKDISTALYTRMLDFNTPEFIIHGMFGEVYSLLKEKKGTELRDAKEFATLMNACGRQEKSEIGVRVCLGDREKYLKKARYLLQTHRKMLRDGLENLKAWGVREMPCLYRWRTTRMMRPRLRYPRGPTGGWSGEGFI